LGWRTLPSIPFPDWSRWCASGLFVL